MATLFLILAFFGPGFAGGYAGAVDGTQVQQAPIDGGRPIIRGSLS